MQLLFRVTNSHVFEGDREQLRAEARYAGLTRQSELLEYVLAEAPRRKKAEKLQLA